MWGSNDGYSYGFALVFSNTTATAPIVLSNPAFTPILSRPNFNDLTAYIQGLILVQVLEPQIPLIILMIIWK